MITLDEINPGHANGYGDGGYIAIGTDGSHVVTFYGESVGDGVTGFGDIPSALAALEARIAELRNAPGYGSAFVPCWLFWHATGLELPIVVSPPERSYFASAELREQDALDFPHDDPCPRCGRRQWTDEDDPTRCQACGAWFSEDDELQP